MELSGRHYRPKGRYFRCERCEATFLNSVAHPSPEAERTHYLSHENDTEDRHYREFLSRLAIPLIERLNAGQSGLDYGCGPAQALADIMIKAGHSMSCYDPFFADDRTVLDRQYDFITCSETAEHFHHPAHDFDLLKRLLRPGGWLAIMTSFQDDDAKFADWHYRRDPTHVVFYRAATFERLAGDWNWACEIPANNIALLRKPA